MSFISFDSNKLKVLSRLCFVRPGVHKFSLSLGFERIPSLNASEDQLFLRMLSCDYSFLERRVILCLVAMKKLLAVK